MKGKARHGSKTAKDAADSITELRIKSSHKNILINLKALGGEGTSHEICGLESNKLNLQSHTTRFAEMLRLGLLISVDGKTRANKSNRQAIVYRKTLKSERRLIQQYLGGRESPVSESKFLKKLLSHSSIKPVVKASPELKDMALNYIRDIKFKKMKDLGLEKWKELYT